MMEDISQFQHNNGPMTYDIRVRGRLDDSWSDWLDGMTFTFDRDSDGSDITILTGKVVDQAALHGILNRIRDLNIPLVSLLLTRS